MEIAGRQNEAGARIHDYEWGTEEGSQTPRMIARQEEDRKYAREFQQEQLAGARDSRGLTREQLAAAKREEDRNVAQTQMAQGIK